MAQRFDSFALLAGMRTGSNLLEATLNLIDGVTCHGEAFNPAMIGYPNQSELLGITRDARDKHPEALLARIRKAPGLNGFRYFNDHDPRIFDSFMDDPACAKIVLTRNPAESYVSLSIARRTGQWKLGDAKTRKPGKAVFDAAGFEDYLQELQSFQMQILHRLQTSGQTAFYIDYDDLQDGDVLNGLARFLGHDGGIPQGKVGIVPQNPEELAHKVENFDEMAQVLARLDRFNLTRTPNFEPRRGPAVPNFLGSDKTGLLFMPMRGPGDEALRDWMAALDPDGLETGFTQKTLRGWLRAHPGHRRFTLLRHPLARAHDAFCGKILNNSFADLREVMVSRYKLPLPKPGKEDRMSPTDHRAAFLAFLVFLKANLNAQTALRVDLAWASQAELVSGLTQFAPPDLILREDDAAEALRSLAKATGIKKPPVFTPDPGPWQDKLAAIYDAGIEAAARDAYPRDYMLFGFRDWPG